MKIVDLKIKLFLPNATRASCSERLASRWLLAVLSMDGAKGQVAKHQGAVLSLGVVIGCIGLLYPRDIELLGLAFVDAAQQLRGPRRVADGNIILYCHAN